jgi:RimJ/RimL family protein N-acetyltransferase
MEPVTLTTARLVLDQPTLADVDVVTQYCQDPLFERYMVTPWPYRRSDAETFIGTLVPGWWESGSEFTWALRLDGELIGCVGYRTVGKDIGYWLGEPHRGNGYVPEAVGAVLDWIFDGGGDTVLWECKPGNMSSLAVARKTGFTFTGEGPALFTDRDGGHPIAWRARIDAGDPRVPTGGWPAAISD